MRLAVEHGLSVIEKRTRYVRAMNLVVADAAGRVTVASRFNEDPDYFQMRRATIGGAQVLCSEPYPASFRPAEWAPIANGAALAF